MGLFPDPNLADADGFLTAAVPLTAETALEAYRSGIFPWFERGGFGFWFCPPRRGVLELERFHVSRRLGQLIRQGRFRIEFDRDFGAVIRGCAAQRRGPGEGTWISPRFIRVYTELHRRGFAHSVEAYDDSGLAGGVYGVQVGGVFSGESMFHARPNAGKAAFAALVGRLRAMGLSWMDTQQVTPATAAFGAREIAREEFLSRVAAGRLNPGASWGSLA